MVRFTFFTIGLLVFGGGIGIKDGRASTCRTLSSAAADALPQDQFVAYLTNSCRYDRMVRPETTTPFDITVKVDVNHLEAMQSQFTAYLTVQFVYRDGKLDYSTVSPTRATLLGDETLKESIWTPRILMKDQEDTTFVGLEEKDFLVSIGRTGLVTYSYKMVTHFYCWMDLKKFPFDTQKCRLTFSDWSYNSTNLQFHWNKASGLKIAKNLHFTEFVVDEVEYTEGNNDGPYATREIPTEIGTFSELLIKFKFHRDIGYYLMDFFIPSYLLIFTAWVTFWLQADAGPPRATLGASTVIAFITLHLGVSKDIPKVSYVKASDIWFLGISFFIFFSLAEFAFVNVIWRRKKIIELKKPKQKYILKSAVMPRKARQDLRRIESEQSLSTISPTDFGSTKHLDPLSNGSYSSQETMSNGHSVISIPVEVTREFSWTTMTPQEVAIWVDRKARIVFPIMFLIFNILYWTFVYCL